MAEEMPKVGDKILVERFHVSKMNMRYGEPFGEGEEDHTLITNIRGRKKEKERIAEPFSARPEEDGYGVYKGSRRFQAMKAVGFKHFVVGEDVIIHDVNDHEAADASWIENLSFLRKKTDPVTRAEKLAERLASSVLSLRQLAAFDGVGVSTYSEWLSIRDLNPKMQEVVRKGQIFYADALELAKMKLGSDLQDKLAVIAEEKGREGFRNKLATIPSDLKRRGIPPGVYEIVRVVWDKRNRKQMGIFGDLQKIAKKMEMKVPELILDFIVKRIEDIKKEYA